MNNHPLHPDNIEKAFIKLLYQEEGDVHFYIDFQDLLNHTNIKNFDNKYCNYTDEDFIGEITECGVPKELKKTETTIWSQPLSPRDNKQKMSRIIESGSDNLDRVEIGKINLNTDTNTTKISLTHHKIVKAMKKYGENFVPIIKLSIGGFFSHYEPEILAKILQKQDSEKTKLITQFSSSIYLSEIIFVSKQQAVNYTSASSLCTSIVNTNLKARVNGKPKIEYDDDPLEEAIIFWYPSLKSALGYEWSVKGTKESGIIKEEVSAGGELGQPTSTHRRIAANEEEREEEYSPKIYVFNSLCIQFL